MEHKWSERQLINHTLWKREQGKAGKQCKLTSQVKKSKQKEERYKNTNKMSDERIMKKITIQIYNNLQVLWSCKSLSQLLGCPLFGYKSGFFTSPGFIVSLVGIKKKKMEWRRYIKGEKGVEHERRRERKKVFKKKI